MTRIIRPQILFVLVAIGLTLGCSKAKMPKTAQAVPGDADIVATVDAKALVAYAKTAMTKLVPAEMKDQIPPFEVLAKQVMDMVGIDVNKLGKITFIGYAGSEDKMAVVAEGIDVKALKGEKKGDHNGVGLYTMEAKVHYAELKGMGVVAGPSAEMVKKVLDASSGKGKRLADTDRAKVMKELLGVEKNLSQLRVYVLTGDFPNAQGAPFTIKGGGFFMHLDKGVAATVISDDAGADTMKTQLDMGMMGLQMAMASGGGDMGMGMELDEATKKMVTDVLKNLKTDKSGTNVSVSYHGDLKPLIEKAVAMSMTAMHDSSTAPTPVPTAVPPPAPAPAPSPAPEKAPPAPAKKPAK